MSKPSIKAWDRAALRRLIGKLHHDLVEIAPAPAFGRVIALDNRMSRGVKMRRRMLAYGLIAASDMAAFPAQAKMHPFLANLQAFFATKRPWRHGSHTCDMLTSRHLLLRW